MNTLMSFSGLDWTERVGLTLLHSLWQIALIAAIFAALVSFLHRRAPQVRYIIACLTLFAMLLAPAGTYLLLSTSQPVVDASPRAVITLNHHGQSSETTAAARHDNEISKAALPTEALPSAIRPDFDVAETVTPPLSPTETALKNTITDNLSSTLKLCLPWATSIWIVGVVLLSLRPLWGWLHTLRLQHRGISPLPDALESLGSHVLRCLAVNRAVRVAESILVEVPTVLGVLRPIVLLPASAVSGLTTQEIEFVLAHELAHVRRHDWLVNLAQIVIEALLFYHPAMWWVSSEIRKERENCCDDMAVAVCGDPSACARALAHLEELRGATPVVAMAANGGSLITRIRRLVGKPASPCNRRFGICLAGPASLAIAAMVIAFAMATGGAEEPPAVAREPLPEPESKPVPTFTLTVLDQQGNPIPHAKVNHGRVDRDKKRIHYSRTADENGVVVLETTPPDNIGWFSFSVKTPGYAPFYGQWDNWDSDDLPPKQFSVRLKKGKTIGGVVHNDQGEPVEGVDVSFSFPYGPEGMRVDDLTHCAAGGTTDAQGRWTCGYVPLGLSGAQRFTLNHPDYKTSQNTIPLNELLADDNGAHNHRMVLQKGTALSGTVKDEKGHAIADADVYVEFVEMSGTEKDCLRQTKTDQDGLYRVENCPIGPAMVAVKSPGYATRAQSCEITNKSPPFSITLELERPLTLRVLDQQGQPIEDAHFFVRDWRGSAWLNHKLLSREDRTGADGRFTWNSAPRDEMQIETCATDYMSSKAESVKPGGQEHVFQLYPALKVSGTVTDKASGQPIPEFKVTPGILFTNIPHKVHWQQRDLKYHSDGKYVTRWRSPYAGYALRVEAEGYLPEVSRKIEISEGAIKLDFALERTTEEYLQRQEEQARQRPRGVVLTPDGKPAAGATLGFATPSMGIYIQGGVLYEEPHRFFTHTDDQGRFTIPSLTPKDSFQSNGTASANNKPILPDCMIVLHDSGFAYLGRQQITLATKKYQTAFESPIQLQKWARVEGRVMLGDKPAVECPVNLQVERLVAPDGSRPRGFHAGVWYSYEATTDHQGRFVFDRVPPGMEGSVAKTIVFARDAGGSTHAPSHAVPVIFKAGETTKAQIGGTGRPVTGKLQYADGFPNPIDWEFAVVRVNSTLADKQRYPRCTAVDPKGRFRVEDVPPGDYVLSVEVTNPRSRHDRSAPPRSVQQEVPVTVPDYPPNDPVDTGTLTILPTPQ